MDITIFPMQPRQACTIQLVTASETAHFTSAICCILSDKEKIEVDGICNGTISHAPNGNGGFGYDPIFDCNGKSFAELTAEEKDKISHRGIALRKLQAELKNRFDK